MEELMGLLEYLSPEERQQLLGLGTMPQRSELVQQQLQRAQDYGQPQGGNYSSVGGAIGGGLGDAVRGLVGAQQTKGAEAQLAELLGQQDAGRGLWLDATGRPVKAMRQTKATLAPFDEMQGAVGDIFGGFGGV